MQSASMGAAYTEEPILRSHELIAFVHRAQTAQSERHAQTNPTRIVTEMGRTSFMSYVGFCTLYTK